MILFKSNVKIQTYKWYLLNIVGWAFFIDIYISLYKPGLSVGGEVICPYGVFQIFTSYMVKRIQLVSVFDTKNNTKHLISSLFGLSVD
jgi:hypothetical protein